ncbi:DUF4123 domain-containing protein [Geomonas sp. Red32]|uniref:DUF4123 domain-containing protein n=1 Tax=Geomonas sp. Red32 TaxID=2912856 RepID=UPI00202CC3E4|nr:DUF4123 domain-containing protein [Geomonas sp. Red32]MCM0084223.1 DUF4123 domain-containing protein [Geomonas sp. Red32]
MSLEVHRFLSRLNTPLYAIIDTARDRRTFSVLDELDSPYEILYPQRLAFDMDGRGPHLIWMPAVSPSLEQLIKAGWGNSWGIYFASPSDFATVRRHLRMLLFVKLYDGRQGLFRFYDPRVLRDYLPTCNEKELDQFFGPVTTIYLESENDRELLCLSVEKSTDKGEEPYPGRLLRYRLNLF